MKQTEQKQPSVFGAAVYVKASEQAPQFSYCDPLPFFRREVDIDGPIEKAELSVQSPGFGKFYVNGHDVTEDCFISATSDYGKILWYNTYDVTALLCRGRNALGAIAGNGFFNESFATAWDYDKAPWRDAPQILVCLRVNGKVVAVSDGSWRVSRDRSHIVFSHLRSGEYVDMRKYDPSWMEVGYDDSDWQPAIPCEAPRTATLRPVPCQPIREHERIAPCSVTRTGDGAYLVDFGVTLSGYAEITVCEERGREIVLDYAEELDGEGLPKHNRMNSPHYYPQTPFGRCRLTASGGVDRFKPCFFYHGFRYLRIEGLTHAPTQETLCAIFVHQAVARRSGFSCGNRVLNYIYSAGIQSTYSNMFWCLTDCPTREKLGWTNDAQASTEQVLINFDSIPLFEKWFEDMKVSMFADGSLHGTIPAPDWAWGHKCGPVCDVFLFELAYRVYLYTGRTEMLAEAIPYFARYIAYVEARLADGYEFALGDWMGGGSMKSGVPKPFVWDMYLLKAYGISALAHRVCQTGDTQWQERYEAHRRVLESRYLDAAGKVTVEEQTALAMMVELQVGDRKILGDQLVQAVIRDGYQLRSGMVGIQYIYHALSTVGRADLAFRLLTESEPGYRSWCEKGESTLWENWDAENNGSHNHHMFSGVIAWFYRSLLGIAPSEETPGFEAIELRPCFVRELGFARGYEDTVRGRIEAEWQYEDGGFRYTVTLPGGIRASYDGKDLTAGTHTFFIKA